MTADEHMTASRDMIRRLGAYDTSDGFAARFVTSVTAGCAGTPTLNLSDVAATLATLDRQDFD